MKLFFIPLLVWAIAFSLKRAVDLGLRRKRFLHFGGWPSTHAAIVSSLSAVLALEFGFDSGLFAISLVLAMIVITDALALRPVIGRQSRILNEHFGDHLPAGQAGPPAQERLPENLGHSLGEVASGAALAVAMTVMLYQLF